MSFFKGIKSGLGEFEDVFQGAIHSHTHLNSECHRLHRHERDNRFLSFAPPRTGNDVKWFVDGCGYMWAVSVAIEEARESIVSRRETIIFLCCCRASEQGLLRNASQRIQRYPGWKKHSLTSWPQWILDWWLSPELYLRRPPIENERYRLDRMLLAAAERGVKVNVIVYKEVSNVLTCWGPVLFSLTDLDH